MTILSGELQRDVEMLRAFRFTFMAGPLLRATGWVGGQWIYFVAEPTEGTYVVEASTGNPAIGYICAESEDYSKRYYEEGSPNNYSSYQKRSQSEGPNTLDVNLSGGMAIFRHYETIALAGGARTGAPITYALNELLYVSENGLLCNDSSAELILAGIAIPLQAGRVSATPSARNNNRLGALTWTPF
jgi:hypothetical protein